MIYKHQFLIYFRIDLPLIFSEDLEPHSSLDSQDTTPIVSLQAVRRMCEDSVEKLSTDTARKPLDTLIPKLIALFSCSDEMVRNEQYVHYQESSQNDCLEI
jgi:hypothetical protein